MRTIIWGIAFLIFTANLSAQTTISLKNITSDIGYLASNRLSGREPGTSGEKKAIHFIEERFEQLGLAPLGEDNYRQSFKYRALVNPHDTVKTQTKRGTNVIGYLDNGASSTIVIGAHFDHLGKKGHISSLDKNKMQVHNGADDNASGTAGVLELARYYSNNKIKEKCNFLFMCFSGEEDGLIGSKYFTNHPTLKLKNIRCMINMDMIGRLNDSTHKLLIYGVGTSPAYTKVFESITTDLKFIYDSSGIGPSDQTSFYLKNIPVLHFFTGQHSDYHKSTDDADKINYEGEVKVLGIINEVVMQICNASEMPFTQTRNNEQARVSFKVTLGIMPDYTYEGEGVKVDAATEGKPAATAGIQAGDLITQLGEIKTPNMQAYMRALSVFKKGDKTTVIIQRNNATQTLEVIF